ncbi:MAG: hypothetical protein KJ574_01245 [Nanoarchaeota archaeon]|nr:hypothetical protein [Nanoarchaeota archaeon]
MKPETKEFLRWFLHIDWTDLTNYVALLLAALLLWWGIKTIIQVMVSSLA